MAQLKIRSVGEVKLASDNRKYFQISVSGGLGQREHNRNIFEEFKRDSKTGLATQEKSWTRGNQVEFLEAMKAGETIEGQIATYKVEPFMIRENKVDTYTCVVFADEKVEAVFASANHPILDEATGELVGKRTPKVILATDEEKKEVKKEVEA